MTTRFSRRNLLQGVIKRADTEIHGKTFQLRMSVCFQIKISMVLETLINSFPRVYLHFETFSKFNGPERLTATN